MNNIQIKFKNSKGLNITGTLHLPRTKNRKIVIICHGLTSNKDRPRLQQMAESLSGYGFAVLRFNFAGSGDSDNREITLEGQISDLKGAIEFAKSKGYTQIAILGESLGGLVAILAFSSEIRTLVLWAPLTAAKKPGILQGKEEQELKEKRIFY